MASRQSRHLDQKGKFRPSNRTMSYREVSGSSLPVKHHAGLRVFRWCVLSTALVALVGCQTSSSGGAPTSGGANGTGGAPVAGDVSGSGGAVGTGGVQGSSGAVGSGGSQSTGGVPVSGGGEVGSGGVHATGGTIGFGGTPEVSSSDASSQLPACSWPSPVDAGPGACRVGRAYVGCTYPSGVTCDDGSTYTSTPGGVTMLCVSDDPTSCPGCRPISGTATCKSKCAPEQYAMSCGGPPRFTSDGGFDNSYYQQSPDVCTLLAPTPSGMGFWCCPCE
jgi:hypothetical protein